MVSELTGDFVSAHKETPRAPGLEAVVSRQVDRYISLGYHRWVYKDLDEKQAIEKYKADFALPQGASQPVEYQGRFDTILAVDPRVPLVIQHDLLDSRVEGLKRIEEMADLIDIRRIYDLTEIPDGPCLVFTHDGQKYRDKSVEQAEALFSEDEVGNPQLEATALYIQHPEYFTGCANFAAGSRDKEGGNNVPLLGTFNEKTKLNSHRADLRYHEFGVLSRGKDTIKLGPPKIPQVSPQKVAA